MYKDLEDQSNTEYRHTVNIKERSEWGGNESEEKGRTRPQRPSLVFFFLPIRIERHQRVLSDPICISEKSPGYCIGNIEKKKKTGRLDTGQSGSLKKMMIKVKFRRVKAEMERR